MESLATMMVFISGVSVVVSFGLAFAFVSLIESIFKGFRN